MCVSVQHRVALGSHASAEKAPGSPGKTGLTGDARLRRLLMVRLDWTRLLVEPQRSAGQLGGELYCSTSSTCHVGPNKCPDFLPLVG